MICSVAIFYSVFSDSTGIPTVHLEHFICKKSPNFSGNTHLSVGTSESPASCDPVDPGSLICASGKSELSWCERGV